MFFVKGIADDEALALVAGVEQLSEHPISPRDRRERQSTQPDTAYSQGFRGSQRQGRTGGYRGQAHSCRKP